MGMPRASGLIAFAIAGFVTFAASASPDVDKPVAVVELFTSQGCNSCPKADAKLAELAETGDVVALGFHVDYWDYLGWKDTLATPENTDRQRDYSRIFGNRSVYTPQIVINGEGDLKGSKPDRVDAAIRRVRKGGLLPVDVDLRFDPDSLVISVGEGVARGEASVLVVYFADRTEVDIGQGRNRGRSHAYVHPVKAFHSAGMWEGKAAEMRLPLHDVRKKGAGGVAVLLQEIDANGLPGEIRGAALIHHHEGS
ncbi:DUF1223 domain-containing protein [Aliihoeflea sp. PC F10.4]